LNTTPTSIPNAPEGDRLDHVTQPAPSPALAKLLDGFDPAIHRRELIFDAPPETGSHPF